MATNRKKIAVKQAATKATAAPRARLAVDPTATPPDPHANIANAVTANASGERQAPSANLSGKKVTVTIPRGFILTDDGHIEHRYGPGIDEMPVEHAEHWYSKVHGVEIYNAKSAS